MNRNDEKIHIKIMSVDTGLCSCARALFADGPQAGGTGLHWLVPVL